MQQKQSLPKILIAAFALAWTLGAHAEDGFYGGLSIRDNGGERQGVTVANSSQGLKLGNLPTVWNQYGLNLPEEASSSTTAFGGYRWTNDVTVEATITSADRSALEFPGAFLPSFGLGLGMGGVGLRDTSTRSLNADVYTSWQFARTAAFYGRLGYTQNELRPTFTGASLIPGDARRPRDGVNYGLGLRYDMTRMLGLRVEYARFGRYTSDVAGVLPDSDQVSIGLQLKF